MPLYKFYRIVPKDASKTDCYIGHTVQPLRKRFTAHYNQMNIVGSGSCSSAILFRNYGKDALEIVLIHELELPDKDFARREERRLLEEHRERAVNKCKPYVTDEERKQQKKQYRDENKEAQSAWGKQWREDNKEAISAQKKQWREDNIMAISAQKKQYRDENKEVISAHNKQWREDNKEAISAQKKQKYARDSALKYIRRLLVE